MYHNMQASGDPRPQPVPDPAARLLGVAAAAASAASKIQSGHWDDWTALEYALYACLPTADNFTARLSCEARDAQQREYLGHPRRKTGATAPLESGEAVIVWQYPFVALVRAAQVIGGFTQ